MTKAEIIEKLKERNAEIKPLPLPKDGFTNGYRAGSVAGHDYAIWLIEQLDEPAKTSCEYGKKRICPETGIDGLQKCRVCVYDCQTCGHKTKGGGHG